MTKPIKIGSIVLVILVLLVAIFIVPVKYFPWKYTIINKAADIATDCGGHKISSTETECFEGYEVEKGSISFNFKKDVSKADKDIVIKSLGEGKLSYMDFIDFYFFKSNLYNTAHLMMLLRGNQKIESVTPNGMLHSD